MANKKKRYTKMLAKRRETKRDESMVPKEYDAFPQAKKKRLKEPGQ